MTCGGSASITPRCRARVRAGQAIIWGSRGCWAPRGGRVGQVGHARPPQRRDTLHKLRSGRVRGGGTDGTLPTGPAVAENRTRVFCGRSAHDSCWIGGVRRDCCVGGESQAGAPVISLTASSFMPSDVVASKSPHRMVITLWAFSAAGRAAGAPGADAYSRCRRLLLDCGGVLVLMVRLQ